MPDLRLSIGLGLEDTGEITSFFKKLELTLNNIGKNNGAAKLRDELKLSIPEAEKLKTLLSQVYKSDGSFNMSGLSAQLRAVGGDVNKLKAQYTTMSSTGAKAFNSMAASAFQTNLQIKNTSKVLDSAFHTFGQTMKYAVSGSIYRTLIGSLSGAVNYVKQLDTSLNDIRIVTGKSADEMAQFAVEAQKAAKALGSSTLDYTKGALIYYQQGIRDQGELNARTQTTAKVSNVTGLDTQTASSALTAVWNGYQIQAEKTEESVDKLAAVAANSAVNLEYLTTAMSKTAAVANTMGLPIDNLNAIIATTGAVTQQSAETVGTAYKTIIARLSDLKVEGMTEEDGIITKLGTVSRDLAAGGINIKTENGELRDTLDIITEIGTKWQTWDKAQKDAIAIAVAGKRQYTQLFALFDNWDMYNKLVQTSTQSQGELQRQQDIYMESTAAHLKQLSTEAQRTYSQFLDTKDFNSIVDALNVVLTEFNDFIGGFHGARNVIIEFGALFTGIFSKQIAKSLVDYTHNLQIVRENQETLANLRNLAASGAHAEAHVAGQTVTLTKSGGGTINGVDVRKDVMDNYFKRQNDLLSVAKSMTSEEYNQAQAAEAVLAVKEEELARQRDLINEAKNKSTIELQENVNHYSEESDKLTKISEQYDEVLLKVYEFQRTSDWEETGNAYDQYIQKLGKLYQSLDADSEEAQSLLRIIQLLNDADKTSSQGLDALIKKLEAEAEARRKSAEGAQQQTQHAKDVLNAVRQGTQSLEDNTNKTRENADAIRDNAQAQEDAQKTIRRVSMAVRLINLATSALQTFSDESATAEQKANSVLTTLGGVAGVGLGAAFTVLAPQLGAAGMMLGTALGNGLTSVLDALGIDDIIEKKFETAEQKLEKIEEKISNTRKANQDFASASAELDNAVKEWQALGAEVGDYGEKVDSLTDDEKQKYYNLVDTVAKYNEEAVKGWDDQGHAIINLNDYLGDTKTKIEEIKQAQGPVYTSMDDYKKDVEDWAAKQLEEARQRFIDTPQLEKARSDIFNAISYAPETNTFSGIAGEDAVELESQYKKVEEILAKIKKTSDPTEIKNLFDQANAIIDETNQKMADGVWDIQDLNGSWGKYGEAVKETSDIALKNIDAITKATVNASHSAQVIMDMPLFDGKTIKERLADSFSMTPQLEARVRNLVEKFAEITPFDDDYFNKIQAYAEKLPELIEKGIINLNFEYKFNPQMNTQEAQDKLKADVEAKIKQLKDSGLLKSSSEIQSAIELYYPVSLQPVFDDNGQGTVVGYRVKTDIEEAKEKYVKRIETIFKDEPTKIKALTEIDLSKIDDPNVFSALMDALAGLNVEVLEDAESFQDVIDIILKLNKTPITPQVPDYGAFLDQVKELESPLKNIVELQEKMIEDASDGTLEGVWSSVQKLLKDAADPTAVTQAWKNYSEAIGKARNISDTTTRIKALKKANEDFTTSLADSVIDWNNVTDAQMKDAEATLTAIGIENAHEYALQRVTFAKMDAADTAAVTPEELDAIYKEIGATEEDQKAWFHYTLAKAQGDLTVLTDGQIAQLEAEAAALGTSITAWSRYYAAKAQLDTMKADEYGFYTVAGTSFSTAEQAVEYVNNIMPKNGQGGYTKATATNSTIGGGKGGGSGSDKEKEAEQYDKLAKAIENAKKKVDDYDKAVSNAHSHEDRMKALDDQKGALKEQSALLATAKERYEDLLESYGKDPNLPEEVKKYIDGAVAIPDTIMEQLNEAQKKAADKYQEIRTQYDGIVDEEIENQEALRDNWVDRIDEIKNEYEKLLTELEGEADRLSDEIDLDKTVGNVVEGSRYFDLIDNAQDQVHELNNEIAALKAEAADAPDADAALQMAQDIAELEDKVRDLTKSIDEYIETVKEIPNELASNLTGLVNNNIADVNNAMSAASAKGLKPTVDQYENLIDQNNELLAIYAEQYDYLEWQLDTYEKGSDKWFEAADKLQSTATGYAKAVEEIYKSESNIIKLFEDAVKDSASKELDKCNEELDEINKEIEDIKRNKIEPIEIQLEGIDRQIQHYKDLNDDIQDQIDDINGEIEDTQDELDDILLLAQAIQDEGDQRIKQIEEEKDAINDRYQAEIDDIQLIIDMKQDELDDMQDKNDALEKELAIEQALYDLENARNQRTVRIITHGRVDFARDEEAVRNAQQAYDEAVFNKKIFDKQKEIEDLQDQIDDLEDKRDKELEFYDDEIKKIQDLVDLYSDWASEAERLRRAQEADAIALAQGRGPNWISHVFSDENFAQEQSQDLFGLYQTGYNENADRSVAIEALEDQKKANDEIIKGLENNKKRLERLMPESKQYWEDKIKDIERGRKRDAEDQKKAIEDERDTIQKALKEVRDDWSKGNINIEQAVDKLTRVVNVETLNAIKDNLLANQKLLEKYDLNNYLQQQQVVQDTKLWNQLTTAIYDAMHAADRRETESHSYSDDDGGGSSTAWYAGGKDFFYSYVGPNAGTIYGSRAEYEAATPDWQDYERYASGLDKGYIGGGTLDDKLRILREFADGAAASNYGKAVPIVAHEGELVLTPAQQEAMLANINAMQFGMTRMGSMFAGVGSSSSGSIINISMGNITLPQVHDGNDFVDFIVNNFQAAVNQRINHG